MVTPKFRVINRNKPTEWIYFDLFHNGSINDENCILYTTSQYLGHLKQDSFYEGDIVEFVDQSQKYSKGIYLITNYGHEAKIRDYRSEVDGYDNMEDDYYYNHECLLSDYMWKLKVVGNKYQNPELLL
jgi:hypothetical protein